ncbi:unnamed protein product [Mytilus coruscus]|uniref:TIR domain-containing protein n=1 Tax=Mytilus coruscus TaxID=42192 RepID=A0A6J8CZT3_MYTCO|nr:unnamed protein product [Mytilus coruscus]
MDYLTENGIADNDILHWEKLQAGSSFAEGVISASEQCRWFVFLLTKHALKDESMNFKVLSALNDSIYNKKVRVIPVVDQCDNLHIPEALRWITYIPFDYQKGKHLKSLCSIISGRDTPMETQMILPAGDVANGLAWGYVTNYLMKILPETVHIDDICKDETAFKFLNRGIRLNSLEFNEEMEFHELYFVGQYAAPVTCLEEMKDWNIAGVNDETMASEAERFYEIVSQLMKNAAPDKAQYCEFIYFDDITHSLADIMEQKINEQ